MSAINQFIPAGSEIVIFQNGQHVWYTTKKNIPVASVTAQMCPVRDIEVATMQYMGFQVWFLESQVNVEMTPEQQQAAKNLQLVKLDYDIPTRVRRSGRVEDPYTYMWRYGIRTSESVWMIPHGSLQAVATRLRELTRTGCTWHVTRVDVSEAPALIQRAIAALQTELVEARRNADNCRRSAEARFNDAANGDVTARINRRKADLKRIEKELAKKLENVRQGAVALGIPQQWVEYTTIRSAVRALSAGYHAEVERVGNVVDTAHAIGTTEARSVAAQVESGTMPTDIAQDYIQDKVDDGTFSLVDADDAE